jgi:hypothetical protein
MAALGTWNTAFIPRSKFSSASGPSIYSGLLQGFSLLKGKYKRKRERMSSPVDPIRKPVKAVDPKNTTNSKTPEAPKNPLFQPQIEPSPKNEKERHYCNPDSTPLWKIILEVGAVAVGLYLAWVYHGQLNQMIEANRIGRESLESVQRAFVSFREISYARIWGKLDDGPGPGKHYWTFKPVIDNSGVTPALNAMTTMTVNKGKHEPTDSDFEGHSDPTHQMTMAPKQTITLASPATAEWIIFGSDFGEHPKRIPLIKYNGGTFYIWGWVTYRDVFQGSPWHLTEFCQEVTAVNIAKDGTLLPSFGDCTHHNCTDDQCGNYIKMIAEISK